MRLTEGQPGARVLAFGGYQPARVVTNDELSQSVDTNDEWIRSRVGIASRRIAGPDETVADMAVQAGGKAPDRACTWSTGAGCRPRTWIS